jgi:16S rRNA A1518/A1519 N6-dimethyltransferase RsmA/KsgA/DIM1 with predicted DNA glycosylase/AP lyase activity
LAVSSVTQLVEKFIQRTQKRTGLFYGKTVIEVGPGPGALTRSIIAAQPKNVILIEKDPRFQASMEMLK